MDGSLKAGAAAWVPGAVNVPRAAQEQDPVVRDAEQFQQVSCRACAPLPQRRTYASTQLPAELRSYFSHNLKLSMAHLPLNDARNKQVPKIYSLVNPLEEDSHGAAGSTGYPSSVFKVCSRKDGLIYCLRRVDNVRGIQTLQDQCESILQLWSRVRHTNVISLRQLFVHQRALYLLHDYYPGAQNLKGFVSQRAGQLLPEKTLWSIATQLLQAIRVVHDKGLSFRGGLTLERVLLTGQNRVRVSSVGLAHMLESRNLGGGEEDFQREDVICFARVMLTLCCMNSNASLDYLGSRYSKELTMIVACGFSGAQQQQQRPPTVYDVLALCSRGLLTEIDSLYNRSDALEEHLARQLETDRLNRLLIKLNLVNERPEYGKSESASWAETGDRYILKLFRDYVFHQTDETGKPWLGIGHIITSLNKLEIGSTDKILLTSRDGKSILVVTFADYYQQKRTNPSKVGVNTRPVHAAAMHHPMQQMAQMQQQMAGGNPYAAYSSASAYGGGASQLYTAAHHHQAFS